MLLDEQAHTAIYLGENMRVSLTLSEKLRDLRDERKLKLQDVADSTGIALASC